LVSLESLRDGAYQIGAHSGVSLYDSLYLTLAVLLDGQMVTADSRFLRGIGAGRFARNVLWVEDIP
jgi:predicted nucleic acid-binding protein